MYNLLFGGSPHVAPGIYVIQLSVTGDNGCTTLSDPIYLTVNECPCNIDHVDQNPYICLGVDINGINFISFDFTAFFIGGTSPQGTFQLIAQQPNNATLVSISGQGGQNVNFQGVLAFDAVHSSEVCFTLIYTDPNDPNNNCTYVFCVHPPICSNRDHCNFKVILESLDCDGLDASGNKMFLVSLKIIVSNPNPISVIYSSNDGTLSGFPSTVLPGTSIISGVVTDLPPHTGQFCIKFNFYDLITPISCYDYYCFKLPVDCFGSRIDGKTINSNSTNAPLKLEVIPNPATDRATISFGLSTGDRGTISITDLRGSVIQRISVLTTTGSTLVDCSKFAQGTYIVELTDSDNNTTTQKMVIVK